MLTEINGKLEKRRGCMSMGKIFATMMLHLFDMQQDHILKTKMNFELLTPSPRVRGGGVCRQNIYYHVAVFRDSI